MTAHRSEQALPCPPEHCTFTAAHQHQVSHVHTQRGADPQVPLSRRDWLNSPAPGPSRQSQKQEMEPDYLASTLMLTSLDHVCFCAYETTILLNAFRSNSSFCDTLFLYTVAYRLFYFSSFKTITISLLIVFHSFK